LFDDNDDEENETNDDEDIFADLAKVKPQNR